MIISVNIIILGTAQDGGIPHFGCICKNCVRAFNDKKFEKKVSSIAIEGKNKVLMIDATSDIIKQQQFLKKLFPDKNIGFDSLLITHLHMGHYTGLVHFGKESRNTNKFPIYLTKENYIYLTHNKPFSYLFSNENLEFNEITLEKSIDIDDNFEISCFEVPHRNEDGNTIGLEITSKITNRNVVYIPDIDYFNDYVVNKLNKAHKVIFDGSFMRKNELMRQKDIPHPPITETIELFGVQKTERFYFTHFNHSNLALDPDSEERKLILDQGYHILNDGSKIEL